jgi:predicted aspartyl protease
MIREYFLHYPGGRRPFVVARLSIGGVTRRVHFLVDTGSDVTVLSPADADAMRIDLRPLRRRRTVGVGGSNETVLTGAIILLDSIEVGIRLRVIVPSDAPSAEAFETLPSLLGRDVLSRFALSMDEGRELLLLLEPREAARLPLR